MTDTIASTSYLDQFKAKAREWARLVVTVANTPATGQLAQDKQALLTFASYIKKGIEGIFGTIDELENVGLGLLPLVPVAVVVASLAAIAKWTYDYKIFMSKIGEQQRLEAQGVDPLTAANIVAKKNDSLFNFEMPSAVKYLALGGAVWWLIKQAR